MRGRAQARWSRARRPAAGTGPACAGRPAPRPPARPPPRTGPCPATPRPKARSARSGSPAS
ncbi:hypothetical protein FE772_10235 [Lysobacter enzymogenes]|nr:hypothetical protein FE772_10235 [Lysobacter enzymogenes]